MSQSADAPAASSAVFTASSTSSRGNGRPGQSSTARSADRGRPPIDAELPRDGAKLRRLDHDAAARPRSRPQHAIGVGAGIVEQIGQPHRRTHAAWSSVRSVAACAAEPRQKHQKCRSAGNRAWHHRRLVRVDSMSSLVVITLLFIS